MAKDTERYETLREKGIPKEKAVETHEDLARTKTKGDAEHKPLETRSKDQLEDKARHHDIPGRADMKKHDLLRKVRRHS